MNDDDTERDSLYERAESISAELANMTIELKSCIDSVNSRSGNGQTESADPLSKIVRILNNQLQALTNVDKSTEEVLRKLEQLTGMQTKRCFYAVHVFSVGSSLNDNVLQHAFVESATAMSCQQHASVC